MIQEKSGSPLTDLSLINKKIKNGLKQNLKDNFIKY